MSESETPQECLTIWYYKHQYTRKNVVDQPVKRLTNRLMFIVLCSKVARWLVCL